MFINAILRLKTILIKYMPILECIPNFSEGNNKDVLKNIAQAIEIVPDVYLLHQDTSASANRTVFTFAGAPTAVIEAAFQAIKVAKELIDMRLQKGAHPRIGATDVCPLVPLQDLSMQDAIYYADVLAKRVGEELAIPVFLYEYSQERAYRKRLPQIRSGQYEKFKIKMTDPAWQPDYGPQTFVESSGATVIGARALLVAFNISLDTKDAQVAQQIANEIRSIGYVNENGERIAGLLPQLRAIGWYSSDFNCAQVSMNLLDYKKTSPLQVWQNCTAIASKYNVKLIGSELIGLMPEACLLEAGMHALQMAAAHKKDLLNAGIAYLKLDQVKPFNAQEKILEYALLAKLPQY
jgi:glutamate formiminotransferase/formiminotetrahydrofolate cyclodeaminase